MFREERERSRRRDDKRNCTAHRNAADRQECECHSPRARHVYFFNVRHRSVDRSVGRGSKKQERKRSRPDGCIETRSDAHRLMPGTAAQQC